MIERRCGQDLERGLKNAAGQRGIASLRGISSGGSYGGSSGTKKKSAAETASRSSLMRSRMSGVTARSFSGEAWKPACSKKGWRRALSCVDGQGADVLGVEPDGLGIEGIFFSEVDDGVGAVDAFEREGGGEFVESEELAIVLGRPAEQAEEVDESLRQEAGVAIGGDADDGSVFALGEFGAIGGDQQRKMRELRRLDAEPFEDQQVLEGVGEVILAADDVADAEIGVVDARGEVVGRHAVRAQQGEVFDLVGQLGLLRRRRCR